MLRAGCGKVNRVLTGQKKRKRRKERKEEKIQKIPSRSVSVTPPLSKIFRLFQTFRLLPFLNLTPILCLD
jgi:hypothetical protein